MDGYGEGGGCRGVGPLRAGLGGLPEGRTTVKVVFEGTTVLCTGGTTVLVTAADAVAGDNRIPQVVAEAACLPLGTVRIVGLAILGGEGSGEVEGFECFACELSCG